MTRTRSDSQPTLGEMNKGAKLWFNERGLNVFPAESMNKATYENWDEYHYKRIPEESFKQWMKEGKFLSGIAVSPGIVYGIPDLEGYYAVCVDWDKIDIDIHASFYDSAGAIVGSKQGFIDAESLDAGDRSAFNVFISDEAIRSNAVTYDL